MIIDIDIKITNNEGKLLHHLLKRFDEGFSSIVNADKEASIGKEFQDFFAEYLSNSGRAIREKLIHNLKTSVLENGNRNAAEEKAMFFGDEALNEIKDSEMEYKIQIGKSNVFIGRIPLYKYNQDSDIKETIEVDKFLNKMMTHAVEKYELNFYHMEEEQEDMFLE